MAFCKFSSQIIANSNIMVDAGFLNDFLPSAPESCIKIYLFGLLKCNNSAGTDNNIENFVNVLGYSKEDILSAFYYWQEHNLVQILNVDPIEIRYLPVKNSLGVLKKFNKDKYASFNIAAQEIIEERMITPNEYNEYYTIIESLGIEKEALLMIIKYCVSSKGKNVNYPYILTVAKNWAYEGVKTSKQVEEKLEELNIVTADLKEIAKVLKYKGNLSLEHRTLYLKWINEYNFTLGTILHAAKLVSKEFSKYAFENLDKKITGYYENGISDAMAIDEYESNKEYLISLAKKIINKLGLQFSSVDSVIQTYLLDWIKKGYSEETLLEIASYCFKKNRRSLSEIDDIINKFYKLGLTNQKAIQVYFAEILSLDQKIKQIIDSHNLQRRVTSFDREFYKTWTNSWGLSEELITYASSLSVGKGNVFQYMNKILSSYHEQKINTVEEAKKQNVQIVADKTTTVNYKSFSNEDLDALFDNLDEVEL